VHTTDASSQPAIAPLLLFNGEGDCLGAKLRPGNVHSAEDWDEVLLPEIARGELEERVKFQHTLTAWREELPPVLSTQNMVLWLEGAAFNALLPFCEGDEVSVGTAINVDHRATTGIGAW